MKSFFTVLIFLFTVIVSADQRVLRYEGFTIWLDCEKRAAVKFKYHVARDVGNIKRKGEYARYKLDPDFDKKCQQTLEKSYYSYFSGFEAGHLVSFNQMDNSEKSARQSNYMTNILPQAEKMNGGAWLRTEEITECYREFYELEIIGGALSDKDSKYLESHSVYVPDYFWKVIIRSDDVIAWIIPNVQIATKVQLDGYLVSVNDIEARTGYVIPVDVKRKASKQDKSWDTAVCSGIPNWRS